MFMRIEGVHNFFLNNEKTMLITHKKVITEKDGKQIFVILKMRLKKKTLQS